MYTPILIGIGAVLLINIILLFCLLLRKPADPSASLREELRGVRQDTQAGQAEMRRELNTQLTGIHQMSLQTVSKLSENTLQNLENTGFCLPGKEGLYNIYIMEELHSIFSAGAGGVTKLKAADGKKLERIFNFKYPLEYVRDFDAILKKKEGAESFYGSEMDSKTTG